MLVSPVDYMDYALSLAELALGYTSPNPAVGAVIVKEGLVVGLGHTQPPGLAHAEIMALRQAGSRAKGAAMYVTLEPCCHEGRTPPCTNAIIEAGINKVFVSLIDPNPMVNGKGIEQLRKAGIDVVLGDHADKAREINEGYIKFITTGHPFVIAKFAMSIDGKIATKTGDSKWISSEETRNYVHRLRRAVDAIMVGANTVIRDNPKLSARGSGDKGGRTKSQPLRVIVDGRGRVPINSQIFKEPGNTVIALAKPGDSKKITDFQKAGAEVLEFDCSDGIINMTDLLEELGKRKITSILIEGGSILFGSLFDNKLIDKVLVCISPMIIGGEAAKSPIAGNGAGMISNVLHLNNVKISVMGGDILINGYLDGK
jgi:diaminohydroxyphosphoribosylaminopyrimidine deaminase / 5-amino-6-(5-phosphoribosylamino)uracil reductase